MPKFYHARRLCLGPLGFEHLAAPKPKAPPKSKAQSTRVDVPFKGFAPTQPRALGPQDFPGPAYREAAAHAAPASRRSLTSAMQKMLAERGFTDEAASSPSSHRGARGMEASMRSFLEKRGITPADAEGAR